MGCHESLQLFGVGAGWWFPSGFFGGWVEIVREVLRIGMTNLPLRREPCVGLMAMKLVSICSVA